MEGGRPVWSVKKRPAFTCNSPEQHSQSPIFCAVAQHNEQDGGQNKRFGGKLNLFGITHPASGLFSVSRAIILHSSF